MLAQRNGEYSLTVDNPWNIPVRIVANRKLKIEPSALTELRSLLELQETLARIQEHDRSFFGHSRVGIEEIAVTPDFHKGSGIPLGTVMRTRGFVCPQAPGKDVNCGMRLLTTTLREEQIQKQMEQLETRIRHIFFRRWQTDCAPSRGTRSTIARRP